MRSKCVTQEKIEKRIAAGDGQGVREAYVPWIKIRAFPSRGTSHIVPGVKVHRAHHLLSNAEYHYHVILEHERSIIDIREQFPLLPAAETHAIASSLGIRPPVYPGTKNPQVLTTDFLITQASDMGSEKLVARSMKYVKEIESASKVEQNRLLEKLEIERVYWERRGVEWKLVLYETLSQTRIRNLLILRSYALIPASLDSEKNISVMLELLSKARVDELPLKTLLVKLSKAMYMEYKAVKFLFFYLAWTGKIKFDLNSSLIELSNPLHIEIVTSGELSLNEVLRHA
ncbi:TnsA endonuclease N-terminal domain-containing protein [Pseudomonas aeruginosa]|uniref:TnsA endonuclease N-terminal domain-containing protein n=1 Tax=Pseudomonas aeruginosa TaxID=287 RepID=UPI003BF40F14